MSAPANNTRGLQMGTWQFSGRQFTGLLDEPTIYHRALSATEIADIFAAGPAGKCAPPPVCGNGAVEVGEIIRVRVQIVAAPWLT